ncbi:MAG: hypothetical protein KDC35_11640 [Acidobacteria bacterium]|nr:hypothetical protein [Acidobacteriota bacterium]
MAGQSLQERVHQQVLAQCQQLGLELEIWQVGNQPLCLLGKGGDFPSGDFETASRLQGQRYAVEVHEWLYVVDATDCKLRPKYLIPIVLQEMAAWTDLVVNASGTDKALDPLLGLSLMTGTLLISKNTPGLLNLFARFVKDALQLEAVFLYLQIDEDEAVEVLVSDDESSIREWLEDAQVKGLITKMRAMRERGLSVQTERNFAPVVHLEFVEDGPRELGYFALAASDASRYRPDMAHRLSAELASLFQKSRLEDKREARFMSASTEMKRLQETNAALQADLRSQDQKLNSLNAVHDRYQQLFAMLKTLQLVERDRHYFSKMLDFVRTFTKAQTATLCFSEISGMRLMYLIKERPLTTVTFSELDSGIYHDTLFSGTTFVWTGTVQRRFELPGGHPRVRNCMAVPFDWIDIQGVLLSANHTSFENHEETLEMMQQFLVMVRNDALQAYNMLEGA